MNRLPLSAALLALLPGAWLVPNHYYPWLSAWQDGPALLLTAVAVALMARPSRLPLLWAMALALAMLSVMLQALTGRIYFGGDALMALVYLAAFAAALLLGAAMPHAAAQERQPGVELFSSTLVAAAIVSIGLALVQWTGVTNFGIYMADLPPGARPFANLAQPNHLCTAAMLGLCGLAVLRESRLVGRPAFSLGATFLLFGMVLSGSRTGWLQVGVLTALVLAASRRMEMVIRPAEILALAAGFALATVGWPALTEGALLAGGRGLSEQIDGSGRWPLALALLDAIGREPWWGYGWQQMVLAQQAVALDHPAILRHFEHSHNIVLDLLIWAGIPVGGLIVLLCAAALFRQWRATFDARALWLLAGALGVITHGLLEFPLEYAYFLIPTGLMLGAAHALTRSGPGLQLRPLPLRLTGVAAIALLGAIGWEYLQAEQSHRMLRLESARVGTARIDSQAPRLHLLTQLEAFLDFARTEARPGMDAAQLRRMQQVSQRFAYPPAMLRYALAAGLNGDAAAAQQTLERLCKMHSRSHCEQSHEAWQSLQLRYPVLAAVRAP